MATPLPVQTLRWRLYQIPGKVVRHAGRVYLKVRAHVIELFEGIRAQCWQLAIEGETWRTRTIRWPGGRHSRSGEVCSKFL
ncbi:MAG: hypothetical protein ACREVA_11165 [Burkholderiales bacterium]